jgi:hypothetical protein
LILAAIRRVSGYVRDNEAEFVERVRTDSVIQREAAAKENKRKITKAKRRREEVAALIKRLYESFAADKIPEKQFSELLKSYIEEQQRLDGDTDRLQSEIDRYAADGVRADKFIALVKRHTEFTEFSAALLNEYVEKVVVHEGERKDGKRTQDIDIYLNFIGKFDVPDYDGEETATPTEPPKSKRHPRTERDREYDRQRYAKVRNARIAAKEAERAAILKGTSFAM